MEAEVKFYCQKFQKLRKDGFSKLYTAEIAFLCSSFVVFSSSWYRDSLLLLLELCVDTLESRGLCSISPTQRQSQILMMTYR